MMERRKASSIFFLATRGTMELTRPADDVFLRHTLQSTPDCVKRLLQTASRSTATSKPSRIKPVRRLVKFGLLISLEAPSDVPHIHDCQGPWNVDLRTPPGPEGSNGSLLDICRGHPGIRIYDLRFAI